MRQLLERELGAEHHRGDQAQLSGAACAVTLPDRSTPTAKRDVCDDRATTPSAAAGFDMNGLLQQAQQMQEQLRAPRSALADAPSTARSAVARSRSPSTASASSGVTIKAGTFDGQRRRPERSRRPVVAAYRDAKAQADALAGSARPARRWRLPGLGGAGQPAGPPGSDP